MKMSVGFLLLLLGSALASPVPEEKENTEPLLFPYGIAVGDQENPTEDDGVSPEIHTKKDFTFFGKPYHKLYVNNNGVVSFDKPVPGYTPEAIPIKNGISFVGPYWADTNNELGGKIFWREVLDKETLEHITRDINKYFPNTPFHCDWAFIATWDHVAYFGSISDKTNTFQAVLACDHRTCFIMFNYGKIQWTTGAASGGDRRTGIGGSEAQVGFNTENVKNYYSVPGSRTPHILHIANTSNVNFTGRWVFQVDDFKVTGISEELRKEMAAGNSKEEQDSQNQEDNEAQPASNLPEEEKPQVSPGYENPEEEPQKPEEEPQKLEEETQKPEEESQKLEKEPQYPEEEPQEPEKEPQYPEEEPQKPEKEPQYSEEEPQVEDGNGIVAPVELPELPVQEPSELIEDYDTSEECEEW